MGNQENNMQNNDSSSANAEAIGHSITPEGQEVIATTEQNETTQVHEQASTEPNSHRKPWIIGGAIGAGVAAIIAAVAYTGRANGEPIAEQSAAPVTTSAAAQTTAPSPSASTSANTTPTPEASATAVETPSPSPEATAAATPENIQFYIDMDMDTYKQLDLQERLLFGSWCIQPKDIKEFTTTWNMINTESPSNPPETIDTNLTDEQLADIVATNNRMVLTFTKEDDEYVIDPNMALKCSLGRTWLDPKGEGFRNVENLVYETEEQKYFFMVNLMAVHNDYPVTPVLSSTPFEMQQTAYGDFMGKSITMTNTLTGDPYTLDVYLVDYVDFEGNPQTAVMTGSDIPSNQ